MNLFSGKGFTIFFFIIAAAAIFFSQPLQKENTDQHFVIETENRMQSHDEETIQKDVFEPKAEESVPSLEEVDKTSEPEKKESECVNDSIILETRKEEQSIESHLNEPNTEENIPVTEEVAKSSEPEKKESFEKENSSVVPEPTIDVQTIEPIEPARIAETSSDDFSEPNVFENLPPPGNVPLPFEEEKEEEVEAPPTITVTVPVVQSVEPVTSYDDTIRPFDVLLEMKAGYFFPSNSKFRKIYGGAGVYTLEASVETWEDLYTWTSISYFTKRGHSLGLDNPTRIFFIPIGLGVKYLFNVNCWDIYGGMGILGTYMHLRDHSPYVAGTTSRWGVGGILKAGAIYHLEKSFFIDLFTDYSFMRVHVYDRQHKRVYLHTANLDGWSIGIGIGYRFGGCGDEPIRKVL